MSKRELLKKKERDVDQKRVLVGVLKERDVKRKREKCWGEKRDLVWVHKDRDVVLLCLAHILASQYPSTLTALAHQKSGTLEHLLP